MDTTVHMHQGIQARVSQKAMTISAKLEKCLSIEVAERA